MKRNLLVLAVIVAALGFMVWSSVRHMHTAGPRISTGNVQGDTAPDFALTDIRTGRTVHLSDYRGKAVLLNFWATWCPPCKVELPWFENAQQQYASQGLAVIGVAMDDAGRDTIAKFSNDAGADYLMLQGDDKVADAYGGVEALPTTFFIGRDGTIVKRVMGLAPHGEIEQNIKLALSKGQQQAGSVQPAGSSR